MKARDVFVIEAHNEENYFENLCFGVGRRINMGSRRFFFRGQSGRDVKLTNSYIQGYS